MEITPELCEGSSWVRVMARWEEKPELEKKDSSQGWAVLAGSPLQVYRLEGVTGRAEEVGLTAAELQAAITSRRGEAGLCRARGRIVPRDAADGGGLRVGLLERAPPSEFASESSRQTHSLVRPGRSRAP